MMLDVAQIVGRHEHVEVALVSRSFTRRFIIFGTPYFSFASWQIRGCPRRRR